MAAANLRVPFFAVVLRKGYGLGAMATASGGYHEPVFAFRRVPPAGACGAPYAGSVSPVCGASGQWRDCSAGCAAS